MKEKGILLPIFSLPSNYGIGDFGNEAFEFVDILSENNITYWEILPINACKRLPYSPISYYALNEDYISLDKLKEEGLINNPTTRKITNRAVYDNFKDQYFDEAYSNYTPTDEFKNFSTKTEIKQYAQFMSEKSGKEEEYYLFLQYIAYKQWMNLKAYANSKDVKIIGDMPVYPVFDSVETAYNSEFFQMQDGKFLFEAGTPPDYFSSDGQKWNCPVYSVESLKNNDYVYLVKRFKYHLHLFDKVRVDYFRGYDSFFKIPFGESGKKGFYEDGVSYGFFDRLFTEPDVKKEDLIIEDLGDIRDETVKLRDHYNFTRQKILQFSLDLNNVCDMDNIEENVLALPGNHDCSTWIGWYNNLNETQKSKLKEFFIKNDCDDLDISLALFKYCNKCKANIVIVAIQDILKLDDDARINVPGVDIPENWSWKLVNFKALRELIKDF